jgi:hypothetical protein
MLLALLLFFVFPKHKIMLSLTLYFGSVRKAKKPQATDVTKEPLVFENRSARPYGKLNRTYRANMWSS